MTNTARPRASLTLCSPTLTQEPWHFDAPLPPHYGPGSSQDDVIPAHAPVQQTLPSAYCTLTGEELDERIRRAKAALGTRLVVLGHHYQRDEIIRHADLRGESFKLSQQAAERADADYIVFGSFQWARCVSSFALVAADDPIAAWRDRLLDAFDGLARRALAA